MRTVERDIDRILSHLRNLIRQRNFTQLEVQEALGWGRTYISQLVTKQKTLRFEQIVLILNVINVKPKDFWAELYQFDPFGESATTPRRSRKGARSLPNLDDTSPGAVFHGMEMLYEALVTALKRKKLIVASELADAIARAKSGQVVLPTD